MMMMTGEAMGDALIKLRCQVVLVMNVDGGECRRIIDDKDNTEVEEDMAMQVSCSTSGEFLCSCVGINYPFLFIFFFSVGVASGDGGSRRGTHGRGRGGSHGQGCSSGDAKSKHVRQRGGLPA